MTDENRRKLVSGFLGLILLILVVWALSGNNDAENELEKNWKQERGELMKSIKDLQAGEAAKFQDYQRQITDLKKDTTEKGIELRGYKRSAARYRKLYENINLRAASAPELDSIRTMLRARALHTPR